MRILLDSVANVVGHTNCKSASAVFRGFDVLDLIGF
jgi:hypothetical protein